MKRSILVLVLILILLINILSVNAGFWSDLFKSFKTPSKVNKQEKVTGNTIKEVEEKESKDIVNKKQVTQIEKNRIAGAKWEKDFINGICKQKACFWSVNDVVQRAKKRLPNDEFYIIGGQNTKQLINEQGNSFLKRDRTITVEPDALYLKLRSGYPIEVRVIDAKTTPQASRTVQEEGFKDICIYSMIPCKVEYGVPQSGLTKKQVDDLCTASLAFPSVDVVDAICFLTIFSN